MDKAAAEQRVIELFGFQDGPEGFVQYGVQPPIDYLFLRVCGGRRSGKTKAGSLRMLNFMVKFPGCRGMVTAPTGNILMQATWPAIQQTFRSAGLRQGQDWEYNLTRNEFVLRNGSMAWFRTTEEVRSLEDAKLPGADLSWFWMDEFRLSPEAAFLALQPALTQSDVPGVPHSAWLTSTPAGKGHWSRKIWLPEAYAQEFDEPVPERTAGLYKNYVARTAENPHLPSNIVRVLEGTYGQGTLMARQELEGEELVMEGLVYEAWDPQRHMVPRARWPVPYPDRVVAGIDFGFSNPCAIVVEGYDEEGRRYIMDEFYRKGMSEEALAYEARRLVEQHGIRYCFCDSADPRWIRSLKQHGVPAYPAKKRLGVSMDPSSGIGLCSAALQGEFFVDPKCVNFRREIESYVWEDPSRRKNPNERPRKQHDHAMDSWRYAETAIYHLWGRPQVSAANLAFAVGR